MRNNPNWKRTKKNSFLDEIFWDTPDGLNAKATFRGIRRDYLDTINIFSKNSMIADLIDKENFVFNSDNGNLKIYQEGKGEYDNKFICSFSLDFDEKTGQPIKCYSGISQDGFSKPRKFCKMYDFQKNKFYCNGYDSKYSDEIIWSEIYDDNGTLLYKKD